MAQALGCQSGEIYFTAGGTEADNLAILGAARAQQRAGRRIVTTAIEHDAVLNTVAFLESEGWEIVRLKPDHEGRISAQVKITCPPGIPLVMPGERLHKELRKILKNSGIFVMDERKVLDPLWE